MKHWHKLPRKVVDNGCPIPGNIQSQVDEALSNLI